jgi:membrane protease YdiL (CAAX protease family)
VWWYRPDVKRTLSLRVPKPTSWPAVLLGAPAVLLLTMFVLDLTGGAESAGESLKGLEEAMKAVIDSIGLPLLVLIPPVVEEIFFRGFVLSAFRRRSKTWIAVLITALLFAAFHMEPAKLLTTGLIGVWLGYIVVATGSIYPAILAHLANNAIPLLLLREKADLSVPNWTVPVAAVALTAAVLILERVRRGGNRTDEG